MISIIEDKFYTHCFFCERPLGVGEIYTLNRVTFMGKFVCNVYGHIDCAKKAEEEWKRK